MRIEINPERLTSKTKVYSFMKEVLDLPENYTKNLNSLFDCLCEVEDETTFVFTRKTLKEMCEDEYSYRTFMVLTKAAEGNPNLHVRFEMGEDQSTD